MNILCSWVRGKGDGVLESMELTPPANFLGLCNMKHCTHQSFVTFPEQNSDFTGARFTRGSDQYRCWVKVFTPWSLPVAYALVSTPQLLGSTEQTALTSKKPDCQHLIPGVLGYG